ncbi:hypothetical protein KR200_007631 [Drosophila serrata]|nr:hypothetical protein KR200_007631 [Drosophila serrata]
MPKKGPSVEENSNQRAAGLPSFGPDRQNFKELLVSTDPLEIIHSKIEEECRRNRPEPIGKRTPCLPDISVGDLLTIEENLSTFKQKFLEEKHSKSAKVGEIMPTQSIPNYVNNLSQTFGQVKTPSESLYTTIMPLKSDEQVNREYAEFHRGYIVSHNHFFPSEQINRGYIKPFERYETFGIKQGCEPNGFTMKKCMAQSDEHLTVVNKAWMDYAQRTRAPLGKKYGKYLDKVPDITFGVCIRGNCLKKMQLQKDDSLVNAISYLLELRHSLQKRNDFYMIDLISKLEKIDKENIGHMPLLLILETMFKLHIRLNVAKIRRALSHFRMIIDEGCATENVNYHDFCRLLSVQETLPPVGNIGVAPKIMYNKETTYRLFTSDLLKKPVEGPTYKKPSQNLDDVQLSEILFPSFSIQIGLGNSDFNCPRDKAQMERIFGNIISTEEFETIWECLMAEQKEAKGQDGLASVSQFRAKMEKKTPPAN